MVPSYPEKPRDPNHATNESDQQMADLEVALAHHRSVITPVDRSPRVDTFGATDRLGAASDLPKLTGQEIKYSSAIPGGRLWHQLVGKAVGRQTGGALNQVQAWRDQMEWSLRLLIESLDAYADHEHAQLQDHVSFALERLSDLDQLELAIEAYETRITALEEAVRKLTST